MPTPVFPTPPDGSDGPSPAAPPPAPPPPEAAPPGDAALSDERVAALSRENEALRAELASRTARRDTLLGERTQLEKQLADRQARLGALERLVGAATAARPASPPYVGRLARLLRGLTRGGRGPVAAPAPPDPDRLGLPPPFAADAGTHVVLVVLLGLTGDGLERVLDAVAAGGAGVGVTPVFLTDDPAFTPFRARRARFEYLPAPAERARFAADLDWELYELRRLSLWCRKWRPTRVLAFGPAAAGRLHAWRGSVLADADLLRALGPAPETAGAAAPSERAVSASP